MNSRNIAIYKFNDIKIKHNNLWDSVQQIESKKRGREELDVDEYVSGTGIKNYLLRDPILDWFELYYTNNGINNEVIDRNKRKKLEEDIQKEKDKLNMLFDGGNEFENKIMKHLNIRFKRDIITINTEGRNGTTYKNYRKTINAMKMGIPIIAQGVLFNDGNKTKGTADLIVRSDYLNIMFKRPVLTLEKEKIKAEHLNDNYHYRVIDIKWTTMTLCANGYTIRNDGRFPAYKGQIAIYNCAIGKIQGYTPTEAYIMAKAWKIDRKNNPIEGYNCFDLLGVIDYDGFDYQYIEKTLNAIQWIRDVRKNGLLWKPSNPEREEMYPNASNKNDAPWHKVKTELCKNIDEITQIWYVSDQHRKNAHNKGIMTWKDPRCTSDNMEITGDKKPNTIDAILDINRDPDGSIEPDIIVNNLMNWQEESIVDFYVDFETVNGCFYNPEVDIYKSKTESDIIFMIGVGYMENNQWNYKVFTSLDLSMKEENRLFEEFTKFITIKSKQLDIKQEYVTRLFHWSHAEVTNFIHVNNRHDGRWNEWEKNILWTDMYNVFSNEPIVVKGALNFRLKEIGKAMHKLGYIKTLWDDNGPVDGFDAMLEAVKYYKNNTNNNIIQAIINYNEIDCKIIWEIVKYLRKNNCQTNLFEYDLNIYD